ncbi:hypothetical protein ACIQ1J_04245 [Streptomyces sp. NPDC097107]|uniref:hypothetical protein n=1 Tax=Streptomyces sp. NPDC097107 TaxID=3366089 RepID=UPI00380BAD66
MSVPGVRAHRVPAAVVAVRAHRVPAAVVAVRAHKRILVGGEDTDADRLRASIKEAARRIVSGLVR